MRLRSESGESVREAEPSEDRRLEAKEQGVLKDDWSMEKCSESVELRRCDMPCGVLSAPKLVDMGMLDTLASPSWKSENAAGVVAVDWPDEFMKSSENTANFTGVGRLVLPLPPLASSSRVKECVENCEWSFMLRGLSSNMALISCIARSV